MLAWKFLRWREGSINFNTSIEPLTWYPNWIIFIGIWREHLSDSSVQMGLEMVHLWEKKNSFTKYNVDKNRATVYREHCLEYVAFWQASMFQMHLDTNDWNMCLEIAYLYKFWLFMRPRRSALLESWKLSHESTTDLNTFAVRMNEISVAYSHELRF